MIQMIGNVYETGEWPKDFTDIAVTAIKKKPKGTKFSDHRTVRFFARTAEAIVRILRRRI